MLEGFSLPNHNDWADVKFEFSDNMRVTKLQPYLDDVYNIWMVQIPVYVMDSNQHNLVGKHTEWVRCYNIHLLNTLDNMFHKYPDFYSRVFRIRRLGYKGDPRSEYLIDELCIYN